MKSRQFIFFTVVSGIVLVVIASFQVVRSLEQDDKDQRKQLQHKGTKQQSNETAPKASSIRFTNVVEQSGIDFEYYGNPSAEHYMTEQNGGGVALCDFDGDGTLDIFLMNGSHFERPAEQAGASNRLYQSRGDLRYADVTEQAGLTAFGFGMGCAAADYNNDGFIDVFTTYYGRNRLWQNNGDGTFDEVNGIVDDELWGTSAAFADLDSDGNLDLYVVNYVTWSIDDNPCFLSGTEILIACGVNNQPAQADVLYRNLGDGGFENVVESSGIAAAGVGKGLAVSIVDLNQDGRLDIYVANDVTNNFLFQNLGEMKFEEIGVIKGVACSEFGTLGAGMGIGCGDYNRDARLDLCVTNFHAQSNDVFANLGDVGFINTSEELGVAAATRAPLGFGILMQDFDLDGWADIFIANGHIWDPRPTSEHAHYEMLPQLLQNSDGERFQEVSHEVSEYFQKRWLGRAAASGDLDNDGDLDLVVTHLKAPIAILRNDSDRQGNALQVRLIGVESARQPLGIQVDAIVAGERIIGHVPSGDSFQASHDDRVVIPIGNAKSVDEVHVHWAADRREIWKNVRIGEVVDLIEGTGEVATRK